jgi:predicted nucleic acid-binding protein
VKPFIDTNVLVYAQLDDVRSSRAQSLLAAGGVISVQVLNEFTSVLRKKLGRSWADIEAAVEDVRAALDPARPLTTDTHAAGIVLAREHSLGFYDALIVASALEAGCKTLLTEDLQHGRTIGGLTIQNPFSEALC